MKIADFFTKAYVGIYHFEFPTPKFLNPIGPTSKTMQSPDLTARTFLLMKSGPPSFPEDGDRASLRNIVVLGCILMRQWIGSNCSAVLLLLLVVV